MVKRGLSFPLVVAAAMSLILSSCGGGGAGKGSAAAGGDNSAAATPSLSKAQFIDRADKVCEEAVSDLETEVSEYVFDKNSPLKGETAREQAGDIASAVLIPAYQRQIDEIRSLGPPKAGRATIASMLDSMQSVVAEAREQPEAFGVSLTRNPFSDAAKLARAYGLTFCGKASKESAG